VLLLDEPLGALDLKLRKRLQVQLTQIHREVGTTFVHVTHDQEEAMAMADRIAVLNNGRIEQIGGVEEIYSHPRTRFVADFIGESNFFPLLKRPESHGQVVLRDGTKVPSSCSNEARDTLMVRPESLRFSRPGETTWGVTGRILQTAFQGSHIQVIVETAACDVPIQAALYQHDRHRAVPLERDEPVVLWWEPDDATLLSSQSDAEEL
jgi:spermidine/putrescine transport system ATP-binding protein